MKKAVKESESSKEIKKVTTNGIPSFNAYSANEQNLLFSTLLLFIAEYYNATPKKL